jgi:hypothetical protein
MPDFEVVYEGRIREIYYVTADSVSEARENWSNYDPVISEVTDGEAVLVEEVTDDE